MPTEQPSQPNTVPQSGSYSNIPQELRERRQWVAYRMERNEQGDLTKIPRKPYGGARARINEPDGWDTFDAALAASHRYDGIEFMLWTEDPYTFIDLDHCVDDSGNIEPWARDIISDFNSYTEFSRSRHGIHILARGSKPGARCRNIKDFPQVELYDCSRPIVMTGDLLPGNCGIIQPAPTEIASLYYRLFPGDSPDSSPTGTARGTSTASQGSFDHLDGMHGTSPTLPSSHAPAAQQLTDDEIVFKMLSNPKTGQNLALLWNGNLSEYNDDHSAADQALCNHLAWWTNRDAEAIDRLFRRSGLIREKWERADYRNATIGKAITDCQGGYGQDQSASRKSAAGRPKHSTNSLDRKVSFVGGLGFSLTDLGNAEYMVDMFGTDIRYNVDSGKWLHWDGTRWKPDDKGEIDQMARQAVRSLYDQLKEIDDPDKAKALFGHIKKSESRPRLEAIVALAKACKGIPVKASEMDTNHWYLNCLNGTIDLQTGKLRPHSQNDHLSKIIQVQYDPKAKCPRWLQFLGEVFCGDDDLIRFAQRMVGYCLTGDTREEAIFILYGKGQCGKSKFIEVIREILGDYAKNTPVTTFIERNDTSTADIAALVGARLVTASEAGENQVFNEPLLKQMTGRDEITCCFKFKDYFTYTPTFKVIFATNDVPRIRSQAYAMQRRLKILPFMQRFYDPDECKEPVKDDQVGIKLAAELPGILAWAVKGCLEWQRDGLQVPLAVKREVGALFESQDPLAEFIDTNCDTDRNAIIEVKALWNAYLGWCDIEKRRPAFRAPQWFSKSLTQRDDINSVKGVNGVRMLQGITLKKGASGAIQAFFQPYPHEGGDSDKVQKNSVFAPLAPPDDFESLDALQNSSNNTNCDENVSDDKEVF